MFPAGYSVSRVEPDWGKLAGWLEGQCWVYSVSQCVIKWQLGHLEINGESDGARVGGVSSLRFHIAERAADVVVQKSGYQSSGCRQ